MSLATRIDAHTHPPRAPTDEETRLSIRFLETRAGRLRIRDVGSGPFTLLMSPDPPNVLEHHTELNALLAPHVRVVTVELPGFGFSDARRGFTFTLEENAGALLDVLTELKVDRCIGALSCVSGLITPVLAAMKPGLLRGVLGIQTGSVVEEQQWAARVDRNRLIRTPVLGQLLLRTAHNPIARAWYRAAFPRGTDTTAHALRATEALDGGARFPLASGLQALHTVHSVPVLDVPAVSVWGMADRSHRRTVKASTRDWLPRAELVELPTAGHFPELEQPDAVVAQVKRLLEQLR